MIHPQTVTGKVISDDGEFFIVRIDAPFGAGYHVYKPDDHDGENVCCTRVNPVTAWFKSEAAAREWIAKGFP